MNDSLINREFWRNECRMTFERNIDMIKKLYESNSYKNNLLQNTKMIKKVIEAIYVDPDTNDEVLKNKAKDYSSEFKNRNIDLCFSPDGICGWKILFDVYGVKSDNGSDWIEKYKEIRGSKYGEMYFPCKMDSKKHMTINTERNIFLGDRVDMFLYDFKLRIENESLENFKLRYKNEYSERFINYYKGTGFKQYINDFDLEGLVKRNEDNEIIGIINIATGDIVKQNEYDSFTWSNKYGIDKKIKIMKPYLDNLVKICSKTPKSEMGTSSTSSL